MKLFKIRVGKFVRFKTIFSYRKNYLNEIQALKGHCSKNVTYLMKSIWKKNGKLVYQKLVSVDGAESFHKVGCFASAVQSPSFLQVI